MKIRPTVIDFETRPIQPRPEYPPEPVGVSIQTPDQRAPCYLAWGHPTGNNCTKRDAARQLKSAWKSGPILFHHAKFDIDVGQTHLDMPMVNELLVHDTMFLVFLHDPHAPTLALKPSAERLLGLPPTEQQALAQWLIMHQNSLRERGLLPFDERITLSSFGKWICLGPGNLVGQYAKGDVTRTLRLFNKLHPEIVKRGMEEAYQREQRLMPILLRNEREGVRGDLRRLEKDYVGYQQALETTERWLRKRLKAPELNFDSDREVADVLDSRGIVTEWTTTATGQRSVSKKNLRTEHFKSAQVGNTLGYRNRLTTCMGMFYKTWIRQARESNGRFYTEWNQVRQARGKHDSKGARTGRLSASLFMNVPKDWCDKDDGYAHPSHLQVPELPLMRQYVLPDASDHWFGRRDFNQQELRILAHFENGALLQAYLENPDLDTHEFVRQIIQELLQTSVDRRPVKTLNFGYIYGQGVSSMAERLNRTVQEVQQLRTAQITALPGLGELSADLKRRGQSGEPIRTWGGREYFCEPAAFSKKFGRVMTFEYKLLNYLIQGSAADCTKEALIRYDALPQRDSRLVVTVHDEIDISAPKKAFRNEMLRLREVMQSIEFDVPMLSDAEYGPNWADLQKLKEPRAI